MDKQKRILLAEDDKFISKAYKDGLTRAGFEVFTVFSGDEVLSKVKEIMPDLILLDLIMPMKNGFEILEELSADSKLNKIPVVVASNLGQDSDVDKARGMGAVDYLIKSNYSLKELIDKIEGYLKK